MNALLIESLHCCKSPCRAKYNYIAPYPLFVDRLVLWSGLDAGSVVLFDSGRGGQIPFEGVISEGPAVRIQFITDQPNHNTGFNIRYEGNRNRRRPGRRFCPCKCNFKRLSRRRHIFYVRPVNKTGGLRVCSRERCQVQFGLETLESEPVVSHNQRCWQSWAVGRMQIFPLQKVHPDQ